MQDVTGSRSLLSLLMAEPEISVKCSGEAVDASSVLVSQEQRDILCQNSSVAFSSSEELGESNRAYEIREKELLGSRFSDSNNEKIRGNKHHNKVTDKASENGNFNSFPEDTKSDTVQDLRIGGWGNRGQHSNEALQDHYNELVPSTSLDKPENLENVFGQVAERLVTTTSSGERKDVDQIVSSFLLKQLRSLAAKERDLEARLSQEAIEHVVEKVEGEVELEHVINEMWFSMRADEEEREMERRERDFEMERREVQLEDEVGILQGKVRRLEDELRLSHTEKGFALLKKQDEMDDVIQRMLGEKERLDAAAVGDSSAPNGSELVTASPNQRPGASPQKAVFLAFEDMLKETDERAKQDRHAIESTLHAKADLENIFQHEQRRSLEKERQLESRLLAMEKEVSRVSGVLREAELALSVEQARRREAHLEVEHVLGTWKEEKKIRGEYEEKAKRLLSFLMSIKDKLTSGEDGEDDAKSRLASVSKDVDKELQRMSSKRFSTKRSKLLESEQSSRWKMQRDAAIAERDNLEEKLNLHLRRARDRESEIEAMWMEREKNLVTKCSHLEAAILQWESRYKKRDIEAMQERRLSEIELEAHRKKWTDELTGWEAFVLQREQWVEEQVTKWTSLLDAKDQELGSLKKELEQVETSLKNAKHELENLPQHVHDHQKQMLENSSQTNISCESCKSGRSLEESEGDNYQSIEKFVHEIDAPEDVDDAKPDLGTDIVEDFKLEKEELEKKLSSTLSLMEELQNDFQKKMEQFEAEKKALEVELSSKTSEVEDLVSQLNSRDRQMEAIMQKFRDEVVSIDREVEKERKEREEVMEMHFVGKRRLVAEIREKEESWQNDLEAITQELLESREWAKKKEEDIVVLKNDLEALDEQKRTEEQRLTKRIHSLLDEKDGLTAALEREQKAREFSETEYQKLEEEHVILLEELNAQRQRSLTEPKLGDAICWGNADLQAAVDRVSNVDKQIAEAMTAIESLREELDTKEKQLVQAKIDKEAEWEKRRVALTQEHKDMLDMREHQWQQRWMRREQELLSTNEEILQQLVDQRGENSVTQGILRELEWSIKHGDMDIKAKVVDIPKKEGMVKVHTSHLEEVDQYILDLQTKLEESEKKRKSAEIAASVRELKRAASLDVALIQGDRDERLLPNIVRHDGHLASHLSLENGNEGLRIRTRSSTGERSGRSSFSSIREMQPNSSWELENSSSIGRHGGNVSSSTWHGQPRDDYPFSILPPVSPGRRQQKWMVDAAWLENVRKEQTFLRHQLEIERQRACSLSQVESENKLMEAAVVRAVEEKHEIESQVLGLQQEVVLLQKMLAARSGTSR
ncbi:uncharacterized protein [Physcomitrium patens]|uniref:Uncharacterized protein n=2 Tax=Physcomitrium patens TaxID=3218 RepID=A0A7I4C934_PHYPA|nr:golgin subfamily A member 6-like protein 22 isoform X1 [Physcomitrium patens]|eukprot:XP_024357740.1 golgin subfamily A member 6-like protein 22 isoform X1 [Physcomitrella patens]